MNLCRVVGYNVRGYRRALHMSQIALGDAAGVDRSYVGQVERAEKSIGVENLGKLARGLGVTPAELVTEGDMVWRGRVEQSVQMARKTIKLSGAGLQTRSQQHTEMHARREPAANRMAGTTTSLTDPYARRMGPATLKRKVEVEVEAKGKVEVEVEVETGRGRTDQANRTDRSIELYTHTTIGASGRCEPEAKKGQARLQGDVRPGRSRRGRTGRTSRTGRTGESRTA